MASTGKCPHCGGTLRSDEKTCPNCGAANEHYVEDAPRTIYNPKTIEELKEYCAERGMPLLRMRFFIGEDYKEPKAFGIYRDGDDFVVYKNKADGSRAVRYRGSDEAHAVNELFQKLLSECHNRGIYPDGKPASRSSDGRRTAKDVKKDLLDTLKMYLFGLLLLFAILFFTGTGIGRTILAWVAMIGGFAIAACIVDLLLRKLVYRQKGWPRERLEKEKGLMLEDPPGREEVLRFLGHDLRYGPTYSLSTRERIISKKIGWLPPFLRLALSALLVLAVLLTVRSFSHWSDGFYRNLEGEVYYRYGSSMLPTDGMDSDDLDFGTDTFQGSYYYLGDNWNLDWGEAAFDPPTVLDDLGDAASDFSDHIHVRSSSSSSRDSSDFDSWDSDDTDWDSDW